jgi:hypothetical protein
MSSSYHPQIDGQSERVNQCLETFLQCFVHSCPKKWKDWLSTVEFWYNTSFHSALNQSPLEALYDRRSRLLGIDPPPAAEGKLADWLQERSAMTELIRQHLVPAQDRMKKQADKNRTECEFAVRAMVYLKLQSYVQSSVLPRANLKLSFKYFGPFKVLERTGNVDHSAIHPVIHVSQLKLAAGFKGLVSDQLPSNALQYRVPMQVLQSRLVDRGRFSSHASSGEVVGAACLAGHLGG